jgi:hypothetical protein
MCRHARAVLAALALLALPLGTTAQPPLTLQALVIEVEGAGQPFPSVDKDGKVVYVPQPASRADILTQPDGSVQATVLAIDLTTGDVKARTTLGQVLHLGVAQAALDQMQLGAT